MYASLDDVKRILRVTTEDETRDAQLRASLAAVESLMEQKIPYVPKGQDDFYCYFDIPEDATLTLPAKDVVLTKLQVFEYPSSAGVPLSPIELGLGHGYDLKDDQIILRPTLFVSPFEGASSQRRLRVYARVEIHFVGSGIVPTALTEGVALLAAGYWQDGPRALQGIKSERIGDYSYTLGNQGTPEEPAGYVTQAMWFLAPFLSTKRVQVI